VKGPLGIGLIRAAASALLALLSALGWMGFRKWRAKRLTPEERQLLRCAYKSQGMIRLMEADRIPGGWLRAGGVDFDTDPQRAAIYHGALKRLIDLGHAVHKQGDLYVLTHSGWSKVGKRIVL